MTTHSTTVWSTREPGRWRILHLAVHGDTLDAMPDQVPDTLMPDPPPERGLWIGTGSVDVAYGHGQPLQLNWRIEWRRPTPAERDDLDREDAVEAGVYAWRSTPGRGRAPVEGARTERLHARVSPRALAVYQRIGAERLSAMLEAME